MNEIWKDVPGYEGIYQVSNLGNVKSLNYQHSGKEKLLKHSKDGRGYYKISLSKKKMFKVHQLVAMAFLNHIPNELKLVINHKDFNTLNNNVDNLEIVTNRTNSNRKHLKSSSKYTGVHWAKKAKKWESKIKIKNKTIYLGGFENEYDAHLAYEKALESINNNTFVLPEKRVKTSQYKGVSWNKCINKWTTQIIFKNKTIYLSCFENEYDAHLAYEKALMSINNNTFVIPEKKIKTSANNEKQK
jgi:hypothetical protein